MTSSTSPDSGAFYAKVTFKGRSIVVPNVTRETTVAELLEQVDLPGSASVKLLHKGKVMWSGNVSSATSPAFPNGIKGKSAKVLVMATEAKDVTDLNAKKSDPLTRGFEGEKEREEHRRKGGGGGGARGHWGPAHSSQDRDYKFARIEECANQSFGHRSGSRTPHAFRARELLEKLSTDPGVVAVMTERELVVNALGEMDPIDDRLMQKKAEEGMCVLGYNTNRGLRIDIKLRTDDLEGFLPYEDLAATLLHELSHNWVGEHDALFWTNYGQMRAEYLYRHASLAAEGYYVDGRTTAAIAGVAQHCGAGMKQVASFVLEEISQETSRYGVPVQLVAPAVMKHCSELTIESRGSERGRKLGSGGTGQGREGDSGIGSARELALAAAERRARVEQETKEKEQGN
uniref:WLM domain-containing protein n=1 Tax=Odontella aurita TaxID=265563 RepID=A0A7S4N9B8_9STRA|mmetsp:Transcript_53478/g.160027  ORF Transcript_53478/g.160027 Transcript_53478/m.160027 type:complete len:402 (+) Transcript_53478:217-1422(+)